MLSFISYWRAASVVLCDLGSSAFYACGVAEQSVGKAAPWFVLSIMLLSAVVRWVFMESCSMFVRGGVYKTVKTAVGAPLGKLAVSALLFDYILTGPISAVAAAQYLVHFVNDTLRVGGYAYIRLPEWGVVLLGVMIIAYFWRKNIIGIHESSTKSLRIVQTTSVMIVVVLTWSLISLIMEPRPLPPFTPAVQAHALGWLAGFDWATTIPLVGIAIAFSHSLLAMSGEEALTQIYREIAAPKMKNLKRAANVIMVYSFILTGVLSFLAVMIIPDDVRSSYFDNLLSGLAMHLVGPTGMKLALQAFIVLVGVLILSGAVNTSFVGANGTLNRIAEDGILPQWLRHPHRVFGTTHRTISLLAICQIAIVILSGGNMYILGEAYAFGVVWSFVFQALAVLVLRWKDRSPREFRVPGNLPLGKVDFPLGIAIVFLLLLLVAITNFFTKTTATKFGVTFTAISFIALWLTERYHQRRRTGGTPSNLEQVNLAFEETASPDACGLTHPHRVVCAVRDPNNLTHLRRTLDRLNPEKSDLIVLSVKTGHVPAQGDLEQLPLDEQLLITNVVSAAEKQGIHVTPMLVAATDPLYAIAKTAYDLGASEIVIGRSGRTRPEIQLERLAVAWGLVSGAKPRRVKFRVIWPQQELKFVLG